MNNVPFPDTRGLARIGVIVPVSNTNLEPDMMLFAPKGVTSHFSRSGGYDVDAIPDADQMRLYSDASSDETLDNLRHCHPDVILYGCTSATLAQGPEYDARFRSDMETKMGVPAMTAASGLVWGLETLGAKTFAFSSPYVAPLNDLAIFFLESFGYRCVGRADAEKPLGNHEVSALTPNDVRTLAVKADTAEADVIVLSCTDMRAAEAVLDIERELDKPVLTSNQALLAWALDRLDLSFETSPLSDHRLVRKLMENRPIL